MNRNPLVEAAIDAAAECMAVRDHYRNLASRTESMKAEGTQVAPDIIEALERDAAGHQLIVTGALTVLVSVLDAAGYNVREPLPEGAGDAPSLAKAEAVLVQREKSGR